MKFYIKTPTQIEEIIYVWPYFSIVRNFYRYFQSLIVLNFMYALTLTFKD